MSCSDTSSLRTPLYWWYFVCRFTGKQIHYDQIISAQPPWGRTISPFFCSFHLYTSKLQSERCSNVRTQDAMFFWWNRCYLYKFMVIKVESYSLSLKCTKTRSKSECCILIQHICWMLFRWNLILSHIAKRWCLAYIWLAQAHVLPTIHFLSSRSHEVFSEIGKHNADLMLNL